ncbi:MAG TPA: HAD family phosphatase [Syntrophales bacterium]|nr:HAD family phosphatase [Syntrophales bacterium]
MKRGDSEIDIVLFDFGGVLAEEGFKQGLAAIAKANGLDEDGFVKTAHDTIYATGYVLGKAPERVFWSALRQKTGVRGDDDAFRQEILSRFTVRDWMLDLVKALKTRGVRVGILSDQTDLLDRLDKRYHFFRFFDCIFNSYHVGKGKRDPSLFHDIVEELKTRPERVLFIDDDLGNVERARQQGWRAVHYVDRDGFEKDIGDIFPAARPYRPSG